MLEKCNFFLLVLILISIWLSTLFQITAMTNLMNENSKTPVEYQPIDGPELESPIPKFPSIDNPPINMQPYQTDIPGMFNPLKKGKK